MAKYDAFQHELLDIAHDILQACHTHDAVRTVQALQTAFPNSGGVEVWWIAYLCNASRITAMPPFQTVIEQQWMAKIDHNSTAKIILGAFLPLYVCFWGEQHNLISKSALRQAFVDRTKWSLRIKVADIGEEADSKAFFAGNPTSVASGIVYYRLKYFYRAPITAFYIDVVFFIVFLCMFSVSALLRTVSWAEILSLQSNANWIQLVTYTWLLTHILDEVEQCLYQGLAVWKLSKWNLADCVMYSWITFGLLLRISPDITLLNYRCTRTPAVPMGPVIACVLVLLRYACKASVSAWVLLLVTSCVFMDSDAVCLLFVSPFSATLCTPRSPGDSLNRTDLRSF